jgi:hypothetical protein
METLTPIALLEALAKFRSGEITEIRVGGVWRIPVAAMPSDSPPPKIAVPLNPNSV